MNTLPHRLVFASSDFLLSGAALSPDLALLLGQPALTGCALRRGRTGMMSVVRTKNNSRYVTNVSSERYPDATSR